MEVAREGYEASQANAIVNPYGQSRLNFFRRAWQLGYDFQRGVKQLDDWLHGNVSQGTQKENPVEHATGLRVD